MMSSSCGEHRGRKSLERTPTESSDPKSPTSRPRHGTRGRSPTHRRCNLHGEARTHPPGLDATRPGPGQGIPAQLRASVLLWLAAVAAGLFETILVVVDATDGDVGSAAQVAVGVAVRLLVFTAAVYLAARLRQGKNWAHVALAVLLGGVGTLSLAIGPVTAYVRATTPSSHLDGE